MKNLVIYTDGYGHKRYIVNLKNGNISYDGHGASSQWKLIEFRHVKRTSEFISLKSIQDDPKVLDCMMEAEEDDTEST